MTWRFLGGGVLCRQLFAHVERSLTQCPLQRFLGDNELEHLLPIHEALDGDYPVLDAPTKRLRPLERSLSESGFSPRHAKLILLKAEQRLFSILHCCKHAMQEKAKMAYWQIF